jgi:uncharacterized membrane protein (DUF106 family)
MEDFLDNLWLKILVLIGYIKTFLDLAFGPLNSLGPAIAIFIIALVTVIITKILTKAFVTKRYKELKKNFEHWYNVRQEAVKCEDREKAKLLAKNIDQAKLNKAYYDYFFEGFLIRLMTRLLPIFIFLAYVNEAYKASNLLKLFGREYVFKFGSYNGEDIIVGAVFWFVVSLFLVYLGWFIVRRIFRTYVTDKKQGPDEGQAIV